jgi:hypothetical protein
MRELPNVANLLGQAMTDYLLSKGTRTAPATDAPAHMAAWLEARGLVLRRKADPTRAELIAVLQKADRDLHDLWKRGNGPDPDEFRADAILHLVENPPTIPRMRRPAGEVAVP